MKKRIFWGSIFLIILINIFPLKPEYKEPTFDDYEKLTYESKTLSVFDRIQIGTYPLVTVREDTKDEGTIVVVSEEYGIGDAQRGSYHRTVSNITKYNDKLEKEWSIGDTGGLIIEEDYHYFYDLTELTNGNIVALGVSVKTDYSDGSLVVVTIDANGEVLNRTLLEDVITSNEYDISYNNFLDFNFFTLQIESTDNGGYTILVNNCTVSSIMMHFLNDGTLSWDKLIQFDQEYPIKLRMDSDQKGNYYLTRISYGVVTEGNKIMKLSHNGSIDWEREYKFKISKLTVGQNDDIIVSGHYYKEPILNQKLKYFVTMKHMRDEWKESDLSVGKGYPQYSFGGGKYAVTAKVDDYNGNVKWMNDFQLNSWSLETGTIDSVKDRKGNIYSVFLTSGIDKDYYEFIIKYNSEGMRLGEFISDEGYYGVSLDNEFNVQLKDNAIQIHNLTNEDYREIDLSLVNWTKIEQSNYDSIKFYDQWLHVRMWINRGALLAIIIMVTFYLYRDHKKYGHVKPIINREDINKKYRI